MRFSSRVLSLGDPPRRGDVVVDLEGAFVLPGLVNAHDHLELNHYGRLRFRDRYRNASEWIDDMRPRLSSDAAIRRGRSYPLIERVFIGALKNLLAGVTLVAHHNPFYRELRRALPIRVLRRYGWAHSFALEGQPVGARGEQAGSVAGRWRSTPASLPFFVHLAEGVDTAAREEFAKLESLGCLAPNTVIVHGVGIDRDGWRRMAGAGAGLAWCPASNLFLFGETANVGEFVMAADAKPARIALCTDSRVSGSNDLLDELRVAHGTRAVQTSVLLAMVTSSAADLICQPRAGRIAVGSAADLLVIPPIANTVADALVATHRRDVRLVTVGGRPLVGDARTAARVFGARRVVGRRLCVDGIIKIAAAALVRRIAGCPIEEPGVSVR
jgi:cytosine/adenosine deaminase-related metal-dependent hydrolase